MYISLPKTLVIAATAVALSSISNAAVAPITAATYDVPIVGTMTDPVSFTSITVSGQTYSNFEYGTGIIGSTPGYYFTDGEDPSSAVAALSNSILTDGVLNITHGTTKVNFGRVITAQDLIFVTELVTSGTGETLAMGLIDSSGNNIAGTAVNFGNVGAGSGDLFAFSAERSTAGSTISATLRGSGVFLSDFNSTGGTDAYGIYFSDSSGGVLDPSVVGIATVPEPSAYATLASLFAFALVGYRRKFKA
ncbi:hypothetical protein QEH52_17985 [Coraliomargarita sp. SDUM461003]|uniref:PEP-CTERM protein-sorting domain-containing protein n=1 Tax=Thalassobacterium maritimum TaxID=3041265 RepID=A0ABU1B1U5_9BACT|nr:hypothetical protein [Coraliomargarita sp. SDUM461003]MDQ8209422.1 hypothetical protein [Coraliomargarita sp. SDUM461003]